MSETLPLDEVRRLMRAGEARVKARADRCSAAWIAVGGAGLHGADRERAVAELEARLDAEDQVAIRTRREKAERSVDDLAAYLGCSVDRISDIELCRVTPTMDEQRMIDEFLWRGGV